jgi:hypothetical protein
MSKIDPTKKGSWNQMFFNLSGENTKTCFG